MTRPLSRAGVCLPDEEILAHRLW